MCSLVLWVNKPALCTAELMFTLALVGFGCRSGRSTQLFGHTRVLVMRAFGLAIAQDDQTQDTPCRELLFFYVNLLQLYLFLWGFLYS